jgi:hypothetical protein
MGRQFTPKSSGDPEVIRGEPRKVTVVVEELKDDSASR